MPKQFRLQIPSRRKSPKYAIPAAKSFCAVPVCRTSADLLALPSLPSAAQSFVKLNHAQQLIQPDLRKSELGLEQIAVGIERVQLSVNAALVPDISKPRPGLQ